MAPKNNHEVIKPASKQPPAQIDTMFKSSEWAKAFQGGPLPGKLPRDFTGPFEGTKDLYGRFMLSNDGYGNLTCKVMIPLHHYQRWFRKQTKNMTKAEAAAFSTRAWTEMQEGIVKAVRNEAKVSGDTREVEKVTAVARNPTSDQTTVNTKPARITKPAWVTKPARITKPAKSPVHPGGTTDQPESTLPSRPKRALHLPARYSD